MNNSTTRSMTSRSRDMCLTAVAVSLLASLVAGASQAQDANAVAVYDSTLKTNTSNISNQLGGSTSAGNTDSVNRHLKNIDTVGTTSAPASSSSAVAAPQVALVDMSNPDTSHCNSVASAQRDNCTEILKTQNSQYQYMKAMYDITSSRETDLKALVAARKAVQSEDYGKLEDNTNKLIALRAQMDIDRQQMESANHAYSLRLAYLQAQQTQLAQSANTGGSSNNIISNTVSQIVSGAILKGALTLQQTDNGARTLNIEGSNGF